jgi:CPA1 family monovalent cation:H+ antiporter
LEALNLLGDQPLRESFVQKIAQRVALTRVLEQLQDIKGSNVIDSEYSDYQIALVEGQIEALQEEMRAKQREHPELAELLIQRVNETLVAIEADTYAEFIRAGYLKDAIDPLLESLLEEQEELEAKVETDQKIPYL